MSGRRCRQCCREVDDGALCLTVEVNCFGAGDAFSSLFFVVLGEKWMNLIESSIPNEILLIVRDSCGGTRDWVVEHETELRNDWISFPVVFRNVRCTSIFLGSNSVINVAHSIWTSVCAGGHLVGSIFYVGVHIYQIG